MRFFVFLLLFTSTLIAQNEYPKDYFGVPLDIPMKLSGNFGELRPNHFHSGFDLTTLAKEGLAVHTVADGYVSRIKISTFGNGSALYITHPNGYTTVYCHLQKTNGAIAEYVNKAQYKDKSFEIELFPRQNELSVKKGEVIAFSGNTGSSGGPHLHFEFRDSKTEKIINPLLFGYDKYVKDSKKPIVSAVYVYPLDGASVNQSKRPLLLNLSLQKDGTYLASKVTANGKIGFGVSAVDYDDMSFGKNGAYKYQSYVNGSPNFGFQFDTYSFDDMRYINALLDYSKYKKTSQRVQKLFMTNPFQLSILKTDKNNGIITVLPNLTLAYRIEVSDYFGNTTTISIPISYDSATPIVDAPAEVGKYYIKANKDNMFSKDNISVFFSSGIFYEDFNMNFDVRNKTLYAHDDTVPVHAAYTITIEDDSFTETQRDKVYIAELEKSGRTSYNYTTRNGNVFTTKVKNLGTFKLAMDAMPPTITIAKPIEGKWLSAQKTLQLTINDAASGIKSYNGYLNGNWILFNYDHKTKKITHNFSDGVVAEGANDLKVEVRDNVGNLTIFEAHFFRSQK